MSALAPFTALLVSLRCQVDDGAGIPVSPDPPDTPLDATPAEGETETASSYWETALAWAQSAWETTREQVIVWSGQSWFWPVIIGATTFLFLIIFYKLFSGRGPIRVFNTTAGHVLVDRRTLRDVVRTACFEIGGNSKPKVKFWRKRGKLFVEVKLRLQAGQRLSDLSATLQNHITHSLRDILGVDKVGVNVIATGFSGAVPGEGDPGRGPVPEYRIQSIEGKGEPALKPPSPEKETPKPDSESTAKSEREEKPVSKDPPQEEKAPSSPDPAPKLETALASASEAAPPKEDLNQAAAPAFPSGDRKETRPFHKPPLKEPALKADVVGGKKDNEGV